jgi:HEAT repeat protein
LPRLLERLVARTQDAEPEVRAAAVGTIARRQPVDNHPAAALRAILSRGLEDPHKDVRTAACRVMEHVDADSRPELTRLLALLGQPEAVTDDALRSALQACDPTGSQVVPALHSFSFHEDQVIRCQALWLMRQLSQPSGSGEWLIYIRLAESLEDRDFQCRQAAQSYFFQGGGWSARRLRPGRAPDDLVTRALAILSSSDAEARAVTCYFLAKCAPHRREEAVEVLLPILRDESYSVRLWGFTAIRDSDWKDPRILDALHRMAAESGAEWHVEAAWILERLVPGSEELTRVLLEQLERGEKARHCNAMAFSIFAGRRELPGAAVPHVLRALETNDYVLVWPAMELVHLLGARAQEAAVPLVRLLPEEEVRVVGFSGRLQPSAALVRLGPAAVSALLDGLKAHEPKVRRLSLFCVASIAEKHPELVQPGATGDAIASGLLRLRDDSDPHVRIDALEVCALLLGDVQPAIAALEPYLAQADEGLCGGALGALGSIALREPRALELIVEALRLPLHHVRYVALLQLAKLGPTAASALPRLREAIEYEDSELRSLAREAIARIEGEAAR